MMKRPRPIVLLSGLNLFVGFMNLLVLSIPGILNRMAMAFDEPNEYIAICLVTGVMVGISSSMGMWMGKRWGWWIGGFAYTYLFFRATTTLTEVFEAAGMPGVLSPQVSQVYLPLTIGLASFQYFIGPEAGEYFGLKSSKMQRIVQLVAGGGLWSVISSGLDAGFSR